MSARADQQRPWNVVRDSNGRMRPSRYRPVAGTVVREGFVDSDEAERWIEYQRNPSGPSPAQRQARAVRIAATIVVALTAAAAIGIIMR